MIPTNSPESTEQFLSGGGEMGRLIRTMDWSKTALGPVETWPQSLRTSVSLCLSSTFPILIAWGPETIQIYNDSYRPICGAKHPESMGQNFRICWETALPVVGDKFTRGEQGEGTYITDQRMFLDRYGYLEESWMTFSFAPIRDESGGVGGIFHPITETTEKMLSGRRTQVLRDLGATIGKTKSVQEIGVLTNALYSQYELDIPFLLFYELKSKKAELISAAGAEPDSALAPRSIELTDNTWPIQQVLESGELLVVENLQELFGDFSCGPYEQAPHTALVLPVRITGQTEPFGIMIAGVSACRALDATYQNFYEQLAATYNTAVSNVYAYEQEQKRAEALAAIDRSKTAFFSNVSHEFRTPLTLMLGPLEDLLAQQQLDTQSKAQVEATHRNALRLLKLVNNLLDYSRVEAGRTQATYEPLDLTELTTDLASSFRSIIEKAGMQLVVNAEKLNNTFYADRQMWEKIVLNLLSNAFKYTLEGTITVDLRQKGNQAVLQVQDTGVGIPEKELPHMFERFHRVANSAGRTHEGTGIGLSLVNELVHLHGGSITVASTEGAGSTFTVTLPAGKTHLPQEHVVSESTRSTGNGVQQAFIKEAYSLLQDDNAPEATQTAGDVTTTVDESVQKDAHILVVDDNTDMRAYLKRLLEPYFTVHLAANGQEALKQIDRHLPALVLSDIMMPVMDGKALLQQIRNNEHTARLPVIFLSARAGEEARIDGLEAGADDYLVKPFSAAELLTKVRAQIYISRARGQAEQQLRSLLADAPVAISVYRGANHIVELANQRMLGYWDKPAEAIMNKPVFEVMSDLASQGFKDIMDQVYGTGKQVSITEAPAQLQRAGEPHTVYLNLTIEPLRDDAGIITGTITVAADVTEQVMARRTVEKINNTLQLAASAAQMGIWRTDWGSDILQVSPIAREIHQLPQDGTLSFHEVAQLVVPEHRERVLTAIAQAVNTGGTFNEDYQIYPVGAAERIWLNTTGMTEIDEKGAVAVVGTVMDITTRKNEAERKDDFISMVSHELKTPLTSLSGFTQMGIMHANNQGDARQASLHEKSLRQVRKMTDLINGFLDVSRLEAGKMYIHPTLFNFNELIDETINELHLTDHETRFVVTGEKLHLHADREKIGTVLTNLFSNALKYAPKGKNITVTIRRTGATAQISVRDEGKGISSNNLPRLFDRYYRVEDGENLNITGFGIGLFLCAEIVTRHGGKIWAESEAGHGATFHFTVPLAMVDYAG